MFLISHVQHYPIRKKMGQKELITQYSFPMGIGGQGGGGGVIPHFSLPELTPIPVSCQEGRIKINQQKVGFP